MSVGKEEEGKKGVCFRFFWGFRLRPSSPTALGKPQQQVSITFSTGGAGDGEQAGRADEWWLSFDRLLIRPRCIRCRVEGARCFQGVGLSAMTAIKEAGEFMGRRAVKRNGVRNLRVGPWTEKGGRGVVCLKCVLPTRHSETTHIPLGREIG